MTALIITIFEKKKGQMMTDAKTTVAELIEKLKEFDGDLIVVVEKYESGLMDCTSIKQIKIFLNEDPNCWFDGCDGLNAIYIG